MSAALTDRAYDKISNTGFSPPTANERIQILPHVQIQEQYQKRLLRPARQCICSVQDEGVNENGNLGHCANDCVYAQCFQLLRHHNANARVVFL